MTALPDWDLASDAELAAAAAAGDRAAFAGIYDRYADRLHDFCVGMVRDRHAAADCVQDVFCIAATRLPELRDAEKLRPWLYAIARNEALRFIRGRTRERVSEELPETASDDPGPEVMAARGELADLIAEAAGALSDRDRAVLELSYRHGLDGPELAEALGVSHNSAKKMAQRLREGIERSLGALLVSRRAMTGPGSCPELGALLDGWDGRFTILMRKRIARHIESCPACDEQRRRLVNPVALLGATPVAIPAPGWLRDRTLNQVQLPQPPGTAAGDSDAADGAAGGRRRLSRRVVLGAALVAAIVIASIAVLVARIEQRGPAVTPADVTKGTKTTSVPGGAGPLTAGPNAATPAPSTTVPVTTTAPPITTSAAATPPPGFTAPVTAPAPSSATRGAPPGFPVRPTAPPAPPAQLAPPAPPSSTPSPSRINGIPPVSKPAPKPPPTSTPPVIQ